MAKRVFLKGTVFIHYLPGPIRHPTTPTPPTHTQETGKWWPGASKHRAFVCGNRPQVQLAFDLSACRLNKGPLRRELGMSPLPNDWGRHRESAHGVRMSHTWTSTFLFISIETLQPTVRGEKQHRMDTGPGLSEYLRNRHHWSADSSHRHLWIQTSSLYYHLITGTRFPWKYPLVPLSLV